MVYEPRFNGELLASLLSIPSYKSLLRRHLVTHFKELVGRDILQEKRETGGLQGTLPLSAMSKVKMVRILL